MSLTTTSLAASCGPSDLTLKITSTSSGFPAVGSQGENQLMLVDGEAMFIVSVPVSGYVNVRGRGSDGTAAVAHDLLAPVITSSNVADFPAVPVGHTTMRPLFQPDIIALGQTQTTTVPTKNTIYEITKATAATITIGAPSTAQDGLTLVFTSTTAAAHIVSASGLLADAVTGSPHGTATFAAFKGASLTLVASAGLWNVENSTGVTVT